MRGKVSWLGKGQNYSIQPSARAGYSSEAASCPGVPCLRKHSNVTFCDSVTFKCYFSCLRKHSNITFSLWFCSSLKPISIALPSQIHPLPSVTCHHSLLIHPAYKATCVEGGNHKLDKFAPVYIGLDLPASGASGLQWSWGQVLPCWSPPLPPGPTTDE